MIEKALHAIRNGASIVTDTQMGRSGINKKDWNNMAERYIALCPMKTWHRQQKRREPQKGCGRSMEKACALEETDLCYRECAHGADPSL